MFWSRFVVVVLVRPGGPYIRLSLHFSKVLFAGLHEFQVFVGLFEAVAPVDVVDSSFDPVVE